MRSHAEYPFPNTKYLQAFHFVITNQFQFQISCLTIDIVYGPIYCMSVALTQLK